MHDDIVSLIENLEKPLVFSSKRDFSNIDRIKNLDKVVEELSIKILSVNPPEKLKATITAIRSSFDSYRNLDREEKKHLIDKTIKQLSAIKTVLNKDNSGTYSAPARKTENRNIGGLKNDIRYLKGIGPALEKKFNRKDVLDIEDLLFYFPRKYEDRRKIKRISDVIPGSRETVVGDILVSGTVSTRKRTLYNVIISDGSANLGIVWFRFNQKYLKNVFRKGSRICVNGEIVYNSYEKIYQIIHPNPEDIEILDDRDDESDNLNFNRIVPIYPLTEGLKQKRLRNILKNAVEQYSEYLSDILPVEIISKYKLTSLEEALSQIHYPGDSTGLVDMTSARSVYGSKPHRTFAFFEFLVLELAIGMIKFDVRKKRSIPVQANGVLERELANGLPYTLTDAQKRVLDEIKKDMKRKYPMNRLLQGDVGSGKTVVALLAMLNVIESGYQAVLMAPTEILAEQHFSSINGFLRDMDINITILRSGLGKKEKEKAYEDIRTGRSNIIVGTHALIQEKVEFKSLGIVVVDEQHRFGVMQRAQLVGKAANPHVLVMTATPIPRTLAITVYGDLDISVIDELPAGRKKIETTSFRNTTGNRSTVYSIVRKQLERGRQAYFVCPMIDLSENDDDKGLSYATELAKKLANEVFSDHNVGLLHGRMSPEEKENTMKGFIENRINVLVSTTVIEVGVDIPNATVMVIENAERFGLSQLHQLRGRIGRGEHESRCILFYSYSTSDEAVRKIRIMTESDDGFVIAEEDLKIRGPGDFLGTKQSGLPEFKFADILRDQRILSEAREAAFDLLDKDPQLENHKKLKDYIYSRKANLSGSNPGT